MLLRCLHGDVAANELSFACGATVNAIVAVSLAAEAVASRVTDVGERLATQSVNSPAWLGSSIYDGVAHDDRCDRAVAVGSVSTPRSLS